MGNKRHKTTLFQRSDPALDPLVFLHIQFLFSGNNKGQLLRS